MIPINDISHHQETCDFKKLKTMSYGVILKAGQGSKVDEKFKEFRDDAIQEEVIFGTYWFYDESYKPKDQARLWVETIEDDPGVLGAWLDLERWEPGPYNTWEHWKECMEEFEALLPNVKLGVYTRRNYFNDKVGNNFAYFATHPLWVAFYSTDPQPPLPTGWNEWTIWQYSKTGDGKAHGVKSEAIDMDLYNLDSAAFKGRFGLVMGPSGNKYRVTADPTLKVRAAPDMNSEILGRVEREEIVEKVRENEDRTWLYVIARDGTLKGWCSAQWLEPVEAQNLNDRITTPADGVTRIEGERYGTKFYLTMCKPSKVRIEVVHQDGRPSLIGRDRGAKFAFNGDDWNKNTRKVKGTEICNGVVHQKRTQSEPSLIVTQNGSVSIGHKNVQGQWNVTSGLRYLVEGGVNKIPANGTGPKYTEKHARSVRGLHADGRIMFLTVDGHFVHRGMTLWEAAELMLEFGCVIAFDGGGGGDSVDVVDGVIVSVPDDEGPNGEPVERKVPQTILVFTRE
ncbi:MAG: SH3 domain-containing protein [Chloroflexi bacterium]|nr:SH3 domain-containing protein [Chloroflexota bacterium]